MDKKAKQIKEVRVMIRLTPAVQDEVDELMAAKRSRPKAIEWILEEYCRMRQAIRDGKP
jgi:energy-coupling factor transporter transmembrane protein EcfT